MRYAVWVPLVLSLLVALPPTTAPVRALPDRFPPRRILPVLVGALVALASATVLSLVLLAVGALADMDPPPPDETHGHAAPGGLPLAVVAAVALVVVVVRGVRAVRARRRRHRDLVDTLGPTTDGLAVVEDDAVYAAAVPPTHRDRGVVVASAGLFRALDPAESAAVLAHEQEHLDGRHHRALGLTALAVALDPLLARWWAEVAYCAERCADERAVREVGDRRVVARAIARAALVRPLARPVPELGVAGGPVPRRVAALLSGDRPGGVDTVPSLLGVVLLLMPPMLACLITLHAAWDLHWVLAPLAR